MATKKKVTKTAYKQAKGVVIAYTKQELAIQARKGKKAAIKHGKAAGAWAGKHARAGAKAAGKKISSWFKK